MSFQSDLKAHLTYRPYTKPLKHLQEIVDRDIKLFAAKMVL